MPEYHVIWEIDVEARSSREAAEVAMAIQRDPKSIATYFTVVPACPDCGKYHDGDEENVDLMVQEKPRAAQ